MAVLAEAVNMLNTAHWLSPLPFIPSLYSHSVHFAYVQFFFSCKTNNCSLYWTDDREFNASSRGGVHITRIYMWQVLSGGNIVRVRIKTAFNPCLFSTKCINSLDCALGVAGGFVLLSVSCLSECFDGIYFGGQKSLSDSRASYSFKCNISGTFVENFNTTGKIIQLDCSEFGGQRLLWPRKTLIFCINPYARIKWSSDGILYNLKVNLKLRLKR